jgi:hypothetical protein
VLWCIAWTVTAQTAPKPAATHPEITAADLLVRLFLVADDSMGGP